MCMYTFTVAFHVATYFTINGLGRYETRINMQNRIVFFMGTLHNSSLPALHLEKGIQSIEL